MTASQKRTLSSLPTELHIKILSHIPWKSHIPCMQVCTLWREILSGDDLRDDRYIDLYQPRYHRLFTEVGKANLRILKFTLSGNAIGSVKIAPHPYTQICSGYTPAPEDSSLDELELRRDGLLRDPLFYHRNITFLSDEELRELTFEGSICLELGGIHINTQCIDPVSGANHIARDEYFSFDETKRLSDMSLEEFLKFAADFTVKDDFLEDYAKVDMEVGLTQWPVSDTMLFYIRVKNIEWKDGRMLLDRHSVYESNTVDGQDGVLEVPESSGWGASDWETEPASWDT
ncbi:hypothetical protein H072_8375 [Dactylellina haptotyla CBS 200.50]|uniref:F-box domain-containing protein n=1 Tax=Dactylellina haptotyla (strain CBS 200.50) TaxID=1284197 RepID=S8A9Z0_DACHA|nr:hypothetical protein H072_8375 [Dactylellina haptotyla CBS 200.50]